MQIHTLVVLGSLVMAARMSAVSIGSQVTSIGTGSSGSVLYEYTYRINDLTLQTDQELDIFFDPTVYDELSNPVVTGNFQFALFQPSLSPPAPGDFGVVPNTNNTDVTGPFQVTFTVLDPEPPSPQYYTVSQFSPNGGLIGIIASGMTSLPSSVAAPEPAAVYLTGIALLFGTMCGAVWRHARWRFR